MTDYAEDPYCIWLDDQMKLMDAGTKIHKLELENKSLRLTVGMLERENDELMRRLTEVYVDSHGRYGTGAEK